MTTRLDGDVIRLEGACRVEEAEVLAGLLGAGGRAVDVTACESMHAAVAQALLAFRPPLRGAPPDPFLRERLLPALQLGAAGATSASGGSMETPVPGNRGPGGIKEPGF